jgi:hypothetical protein
MCSGIDAADKLRIHSLLLSVRIEGMRHAAIAPQVLAEFAMAATKNRG